MLFGPDVTEDFLQANNLSLLIRSHQCVDLGFLFMHNDKCLTVFSASRYGGSYDNKGAVIVMRRSKGLKTECIQYETQTAPGTNWDENMLQSNMSQLKELITEHREALRSLFSAKEASNAVSNTHAHSHRLWFYSRRRRRGIRHGYYGGRLGASSQRCHSGLVCPPSSSFGCIFCSSPTTA